MTQLDLEMAPVGRPKTWGCRRDCAHRAGILCTKRLDHAVKNTDACPYYSRRAVNGDAALESMRAVMR